MRCRPRHGRRQGRTWHRFVKVHQRLRYLQAPPQRVRIAAGDRQREGNAGSAARVGQPPVAAEATDHEGRALCLLLPQHQQLLPRERPQSLLAQPLTGWQGCTTMRSMSSTIRTRLWSQPREKTPLKGLRTCRAA